MKKRHKALALFLGCYFALFFTGCSQKDDKFDSEMSFDEVLDLIDDKDDTCLDEVFDKDVVDAIDKTIRYLGYSKRVNDIASNYLDARVTGNAAGYVTVYNDEFTYKDYGKVYGITEEQIIDFVSKFEATVSLYKEGVIDYEELVQRLDSFNSPYYISAINKGVYDGYNIMIYSFDSLEKAVYYDEGIGKIDISRLEDKDDQKIIEAISTHRQAVYDAMNSNAYHFVGEEFAYNPNRCDCIECADINLVNDSKKYIRSINKE